MGTITGLIDPEAKELAWFRKHSPKLEALVTKVLEGGDIAFQYEKGNGCWYENRHIGLGTSDPNLYSNIMFELCNAYIDCILRLKPALADHNNAMTYATTVEKGEWEATKLHYDICCELEKADAKFAPLNRFKPGFTRLQKSWAAFENYLADQVDHTKKIAGDYERWKTRQSGAAAPAAAK